jgi:excisionase family DNA binding protein
MPQSTPKPLPPHAKTGDAYQAGEILGIGHNQVRQLVRAGKLRALPGRNIKIPLVAIEEYLATCTRDAA